jgi:cation transporter-like permease
MQLLTLFALSIVSAILMHQRMPSVLLPSLISAMVSAIAFHLIGSVVDAAPDSLVLVSLITTFVIAFFIAVTLGLLMRSSGRKPPTE